MVCYGERPISYQVEARDTLRKRLKSFVFTQEEVKERNTINLG